MSEFQFSCPQCGGRIQCGVTYSGTQINCPVCQQPITVPPVSPVAAAMPVTAKSQTVRNVLMGVAGVVVLAALVAGGWYGYSKIRMHQLSSGLVASWSGEGNGKNLVSGNNATLTDITFADGQVGQAFSLNGESSYLKVPRNPAMNIDSGSGFSFTAWIKPADGRGYHPILRWSTPGSGIGVSLRIGHTPADSGVIYSDLFDKGGGMHDIYSKPGVVVGGKFQFVTLTYDRASGQAKLYLNGVVVAQTRFATPMTFDAIGSDLYIGCEGFNSAPGSWSYNKYFSGLIDGIAIYKRALSADEIKAIETEQNHGDPLTLPASSTRSKN